MASCNMCRNGLTALGRDCPNRCQPASVKNIANRLQSMSERAASEEDRAALRDAIGVLTLCRDAVRPKQS